MKRIRNTHHGTSLAITVSKNVILGTSRGRIGRGDSISATTSDTDGIKFDGTAGALGD